MAFNDVLKKLRNARGITQEDVAKDTGLSKSTISMYESGNRKPSFEVLELFADYFNVDMNTLTEKGLQSPQLKKQAIRINVYGSIPAGIPIEAVEDIEDWEEIPAEMVEGGKEFIALKVKGDSMYPKYMENDVVIIQLQPDCENGQDCAIYVNGYNATLKTVKKKEGEITLIPVNTNYMPKTYRHPGEVSILGVVVELRRKI